MASYSYTFNSGDSVTPTKLNDARTVSDIVNADIKSDAAIAGSKIDPLFLTAVTMQNDGPAAFIPSRADNSTNGSAIQFKKFRGTHASKAAVLAGDQVGRLRFFGYDGANEAESVEIFAEVDGTPGTNDMPGRLIFATSADGSATPTERMRIDASGNVGIGKTAAASIKLDVNGTVAATTLRCDTLQNSETNEIISLDPADDTIKFSTNANERMRIDSSGNVGIGTTNPNQLLDLASAAPNIRLTDTADGHSEIDGNAADLRFHADKGNTKASSIIGFYVDNAEKVRITSGGNVGIGNTSPAVKLDVTGDINCSEAYGVDGVQVVANRRTGWTSATGTATRTTFATSTVTTAQLAERVKALIDDLSSHGLIGT